MAEARTQQAPGRRASPSRFTALELAAAEHLIHLSESSSSSAAAAPAAFSVGSAASSCSSLRSVNNAPALPRGVGLPPPPPPPVAEDDDDEQERCEEVGGMRRRRNKRYRPIAEIYAATDPNPIQELAGRKDRDKPRTKPAVGAGNGKQEPRGGGRQK